MEKQELKKNRLISLAQAKDTDKGLFLLAEINDLDDKFDNKIDTTVDLLKKSITESVTESINKSTEQVIEQVKEMIPKVKDGVKGKDGVDGKDGAKGEKGETTIVEKIIERTEVKEVPIVTENIVEVAKYEEPEQIVGKINISKVLIEPEQVKGFRDLEMNLKHNSEKLYTGVNETRVRELIKTLATGGTPAGSTGQLQINNAGAFGAVSASTGLTSTGNSGTLKVNLSTGVAGGQSVIGGTAASDNLTLSSTTNGTKGRLLFGNSAYDEASNLMSLGSNTARSSTVLRIQTSAGQLPLVFTGTGISVGSGTDNNEGVFMGMGYNSNFKNKQLWIGDSSQLGNDNYNVFRMITGFDIPMIDAVTAGGSSRSNVNLAYTDNNVGVGFDIVTDSQSSITAKLQIVGEQSKISFQVDDFAVGSKVGDYISINAGGTPIFRIDQDGVPYFFNLPNSSGATGSLWNNGGAVYIS